MKLFAVQLTPRPGFDHLTPEPLRFVMTVGGRVVKAPATFTERATAEFAAAQLNRSESPTCAEVVEIGEVAEDARRLFAREMIERLVREESPSP